ncbi:MAG TPA: hypothetical protein VFC78_24995 [Tepidisphaeraceae bacterium]|nr:hypothetical protein [Tepidisphaeraceae bacterium]
MTSLTELEAELEQALAIERSLNLETSPTAPQAGQESATQCATAPPPDPSLAAQPRAASEVPFEMKPRDYYPTEHRTRKP